MDNPNWRKIIRSSTTEVALSYFIMRKNMRKPWATDEDFYNLISNRFRRKGDALTVLSRMAKYGYLDTTVKSRVTYFAITEFGSEIPSRLANMRKNSPHFKTKDAGYDDED